MAPPISTTPYVPPPVPDQTLALEDGRNFSDGGVRLVAHHILEAIRYRRHLYGLQLTDARSVFEAMDRDGDGKLSKIEFEKALKFVDAALVDAIAAERL